MFLRGGGNSPRRSFSIPFGGVLQNGACRHEFMKEGLFRAGASETQSVSGRVLLSSIEKKHRKGQARRSNDLFTRIHRLHRFQFIASSLHFGGCQKGGFPKGWFWRTFPRNENRNEGAFGCSPGTKTGTRVHSDVPRSENRNEGTVACSARTKTGTRVRSHVPPERKPERGYVRQNHPFTKPPFCLLSIIVWGKTPLAVRESF